MCTVCMPNSQGGQKLLEPLELELEVDVSTVS